MDVLLTTFKWQALVYLDYIVIFLQTPDEPIDHVRQVFSLLNDAGWTLNLKNENFSQAASITLATLFAQGASKC